MSIEGHITVEMRRANDGIGVVDIKSTRRTDIANFLVGKPSDQAVSLLPIVFNVCGKAHAQAAQQAIGQYESNGCLTVYCENAREHLLRIFTSWTDQSASQLKEIDFSQVMTLVSNMEMAINNDRDEITHIAHRLQEFLNVNLFHRQPQDWLTISSSDELRHWARQTNSVAGRYIQGIIENNLATIGAIEAKFLPDISPKKLSGKMHEDSVVPFSAQPQWAGGCYETGPLARNKDHPLIKSLALDFGYGLLTRQTARLIDLAKIACEIDCYKGMTAPSHTHEGFGQVETSRGRLTHSTVLRDGIIADYKILAPTEWNFHPKGVLFESLQQIPVSSKSETEKMARMIVEAIDPCVAFDVRVH